jgi:phospholipase C
MVTPNRTARPKPAAAVAAVLMLAGLVVAGLVVAAGVLTAGRAQAAGTGQDRSVPALLRVIAGPGRGGLSDPFGVAAGTGGTIWAVSRASGRVTGYSPAGRLIAAFGSAGTGPGELPGGLAGPEGIAIGPGGRIWVADTGHDRVVEFSPAGRVLDRIGSPGSGRGQLSQPAAVAVSGSGTVYVADQGNGRVEAFSPAGAYLSAIPVPAPAGVALDPAGQLWVTSQGFFHGNTVREYSAAGIRLRSFGRTRTGSFARKPSASPNRLRLGYTALSDPAGIAVGPDGQILVAQPDYGWVAVYQPDGRFVTEFGAPGGSGQGDALGFPQDVAVTSGGRAWVADSGNDRLAEFSVPALPAARSGPPWPLWLALAALVLLGGLAAGYAWQRRASRSPGPAPEPRSGPGREQPPASARLDRRHFLAGAAILTGAACGSGLLPSSLRAALAASQPGGHRGQLADLQHIVILMQENRSFDHYYGTMPGVRGFADPAAIRLPDGRPVWYQPDPSHPDGYLLPFHYDTQTTSSQATPGTDHSWRTQHDAWAGGKMDGWVAAKGPFTMGHYTAADIPFHWALASAFTLCDNYHCSVLGPTDPNRLHLWTGTIDAGGRAGGPVTTDAPTFSGQRLSWTTYPERLERAGVSWQVYQEEDNFDNNPLAWFTQYLRAPRSSPLYQRGLAARPAGSFEADARAGRLPRVSWLVAPTAQSEHPRYLPAAGAEYIAQKLDAIASNPRVWAKTAFILTYDENDGLFDHVPPPVPPPGTPGEFVRGEPAGLGFRVPTTIVSPWTAGGLVCSDVFDHTSVLRLIETRFGVREPSITAWRRRTCGDLTSAFRFGRGPAAFPAADSRLRLAAAEDYLLTAQQQVSANPPPVIPAARQTLPRQ